MRMQSFAAIVQKKKTFWDIIQNDLHGKDFLIVRFRGLFKDLTASINNTYSKSATLYSLPFPAERHFLQSPLSHFADFTHFSGGTFKGTDINRGNGLNLYKHLTWLRYTCTGSSFIHRNQGMRRSGTQGIAPNIRAHSEQANRRAVVSSQQASDRAMH